MKRKITFRIIREFWAFYLCLFNFHLIFKIISFFASNLSYILHDEKLLNIQYVAICVSYFRKNLMSPFYSFLQDTEDEKFKKRQIIRVKLLVFLVKTKVVIKMLDNCCQIRANDIFQDSSPNNAYQSYENLITYVILADKDKFESDYQKLGKSMQRFFFSMLKGNGVKVRYSQCLQMIRNPNYYNLVFDRDRLKAVKRNLNKVDSKDILTPSAMFKYLGSFFKSGVGDYSDLHLCFPDPEFLYMYYRLIDSKMSIWGLKMISEKVVCRKKMYIPLDIFEGEFDTNYLFPQTKIRILKNKDFARSIPAQFFVIKEFLLKKSYKNSCKPKYVRHFARAVRNYELFNRKLFKSMKSNLYLLIY